MKSRAFYTPFQSPLGMLYVIFSGKDLAGISFKRPQMLRLGEVPAGFIKQLSAYFDGRLREFHQSISFLEGTDFERRIWLALRDIPYGETRTYKWLAGKVGTPKGSRAVGQALSKNPIPIVLPCHRIIESDGSIGGYSPGVDIKRRLLDMEYYYSQTSGASGR